VSSRFTTQLVHRVESNRSVENVTKIVSILRLVNTLAGCGEAFARSYGLLSYRRCSCLYICSRIPRLCYLYLFLEIVNRQFLDYVPSYADYRYIEVFSPYAKDPAIQTQM
jgi:hypothetical protein